MHRRTDSDSINFIQPVQINNSPPCNQRGGIFNGGDLIGTTWIKPLHVNKGKSIAQTISERTDYVEDPDKTDNYRLITSYGCAAEIADTEFYLSKREYERITGRNQGKHDVLAYHIRQAFRPGEIDATDANRIGYELATRWTHGNHAFIVCTHVNTESVHNHIIFNSTTLDCERKYDDFLGSAFALRRLSDRLCLENGLSIIENPKQHSKSKYKHYGQWLKSREASLCDQKKPSQREKLMAAIDMALSKKPEDFDAFLRLMEADKYEYKRRCQTVSFRGPGAKGFIRLSSLKDANYTEDALRERISGRRVVTPKREPANNMVPPMQNLLFDLQRCVVPKGTPGYDRWAAVFNLKQLAKTFNYLQENSLLEMEALNKKAQSAKHDFNSLSTGIKTADTRLKEISVLQKHIGAYGKTKDIYTNYKKSGYSKKFLTEHEKQIVAYKVTKVYFDEYKTTHRLDTLPSMQSLKSEYAALVAEKKKLYSQYHEKRNAMQEILIVRDNAERLLGYAERQQAQETKRDER